MHFHLTQPAPTTAQSATLLAQFDARAQGFATIITDTPLHDDITAYAQSVAGQFDHIVVLGIGGSALGTQTLRDTLAPTPQSGQPTLHIIDNVDPDLIRQVSAQLDLARTLFITISKSGTTPETMALMRYFEAQLTAQSLPLSQHVVYVTDPEKGFLRQRALTEGIRTFPIPPNVGGRFSVLTAVGLLPATLIGIDLAPLLAGARAMAESFRHPDPEHNFPLQLATWLHAHAAAGRTSVVLMPYVQRLRTFGEWHAQLLAESTGKVNASGQAVGLTPLSALGATDQHSQLQLYAQGPDDKVYVFFSRTDTGPALPIPPMAQAPQSDILQGVDFGHLLNVEMRATLQTLSEIGRPTLHLEFEQITAFELGQLFLLFEGAVAFLGELMEINAFDQPGVERSKVLTRQFLSA